MKERDEREGIKIMKTIFLAKKVENSTNQIAVFKSRDPQSDCKTEISIIGHITKF